MADQINRDLMQRFANRGGIYTGMDIPEFYEMARELFTPEEARVAAATPRGFFTAEQLSAPLGKSAEEVEAMLQTESWGPQTWIGAYEPL